MIAKTSGVLKLVYCVGLLVFGTMNTLTMKGQFNMTSIGSGGEIQYFSKPWFATFTVFFACTLVFINDFFIWCCACCRRSQPPVRDVPLLADNSPENDSAAKVTGERTSYWSKVPLVSIPAAIDVFATSFGCIGLVFVPASVFQMLKGSMIIFAAIFTKFFLHRQLFCFHWLGVCLCVLGVTTVGTASLCQDKPSSDPNPSIKEPAGDVALGIVLIIFGQVLQAAQMVLEEWLMKSVQLSGSHVIGWEGTWGCLLILAFVFPAVYYLPGSDNGRVEDFGDTLTMLYNSMGLQILVTMYTISCCFYNIFGISVTGALSTVHRTMLEASRTFFVWAATLFVHYFVDSESKFGEAWTIYSYLQLAGFLFLIFGQAVYGEVIRIPGWSYPPVTPVERKLSYSTPRS